MDKKDYIKGKLLHVKRRVEDRKQSDLLYRKTNFTSPEECREAWIKSGRDFVAALEALTTISEVRKADKEAYWDEYGNEYGWGWLMT